MLVPEVLPLGRLQVRSVSPLPMALVELTCPILMVLAAVMVVI